MTQREAIVIADLQYGMTGKGSLIDALTRWHEAHTVIRYNGGPQASAHVRTPEGHAHTFSQFSSGTFAHARTHLSRYMLIDPLAMRREETLLRKVGAPDIFFKTTIDYRAFVITPFHRAMNHLRELSRGSARHGSSGTGMAEALSDAAVLGDDTLFAGDLKHRPTILAKLNRLRDYKIAQLDELKDHIPLVNIAEHELEIYYDPYMVEICTDAFADFGRLVRIVSEEFVERILNRDGTVIFEGAQGLLLDQWHGFYPYTSWSNTTMDNALEMLSEYNYEGRITRLGVARAYMLRHGPGPFLTEDSELHNSIPVAHQENDWQGPVRLGHFDLLATNYAIEANGPLDFLALTGLDQLANLQQWYYAARYRYQGDQSTEGYFLQTDNYVKAMIPNFAHDLQRQAHLTELLNHCIPDYEAFTPSDSDSMLVFAEMLAHNMRLPLALISTGPTVNTKKTFNPWRQHFSNHHSV